MINNARQFSQARRTLTRYLTLKRRLANLLTNFQLDDVGLISTVEDRISQLTEELSDYQRHGSSELDDLILILSNLSNVPSALVKARLLFGWSQSEFAARTGLSRQQVHVYEQTAYSTISLKRLLSILEVMQTAAIRRNSLAESNLAKSEPG